ncbi:MAG: ribF [Ilumatobacteraceae bacterium]|nr:ribF [Ilumatobacteraceae bacterium]
MVLGEFDGFHLGHRQLVDEAARLAVRMRLPLIGVVLDDPRATHVITSVEERCWALLACGAAHAIAVTFASPDHPAAGVHAVDEIVERLDPQVIVTACLPGSPAIARYPALRDECIRRGLEVVEVPRWPDPDGGLITGARIRDALGAGDMVRVNDWLGRTFTLTGTVVHGSGLGRTIGFPTANLDLPANLLVPMHGVYAAIVDLPNGARHRAAVNIGVRPTVEEHGELLVEAHLLDFDGDLYEMRIQVGFRRWLRDERRFDSIDALVTQLGADVQQIRLLLRH